MAEPSSINFKKSFAINTEHNDRTLAPSYLIDKTYLSVIQQHSTQEPLKMKL